jgi:hypothetical protein
MMALSDSPMSKPIPVARSSLYFHKWQYVILFLLPEASFLRELKHEKIDQTIAYRNEWIGRRGGTKNITPTEQQILHDACNYLLTRSHPYKKVVCGNGLWLYTNNPEDFEDIDAIPTGQILYVNQAQVTLTPNAVTLTHPKHAFRTYFRDRWLTNDELVVLRRYFSARPYMFRQGPGFKKLVQGKRMWIASNFFVDHNEPNADFLINMAVPGIVRKTLPIIARAK